MPRKLPAELAEIVRQRARFLCEYCHTDERWQCVRFTIDHFVPITEGGEDRPDNLALACFHCNRRKSDRQNAADTLNGHIVPLFNPRQDNWAQHFIWSGNGRLIIPLTATGRATAELLQFNRERLQEIRAADFIIDRHPPLEDPLQPVG